MKNKFLAFTVLLSAMSLTTKANLKDALEPVLDDWIEPAYPVIVGIVFIVGVIVNLGKFTNEDTRDIKKGIINIVIFLIVVLAVGGIYTVIRNTTL
ncbi:hypothetical protein SAMN06265379_11256 [Saccharicrinis carchari]|uniref:TrbC/VIRB2 family protein n=2 Tax=Saccharicrinis carchari TaxID=1168039 RepID=A0A521F2B8_SACCC|nr:hypothetical protein SAMN06265379_11256 [Saccharicrinis carchari]